MEVQWGSGYARVAGGHTVLEKNSVFIIIAGGLS